MQTVPTMKNDHDLSGDTGQSGLTQRLNGDSDQTYLTLQLFPLETIVTSTLFGQNHPINQIQLSAEWILL